MKSIVLTGLPGSGKSTLGRMLAERINLPFFDSDEEIEKAEGVTVAEIFAKKGESGFRVAETAVLKKLLDNENTVIATGGGIVEREENLRELKKRAVVVYINRSVEDICSDIDISARPLLADGAERVLRLAERRNALYSDSADIEIINRGTEEEVLERIKEKLVDGKFLPKG